MKTITSLLILVICSLYLPAQSVYWVATDGNNTTGNGSSDKPWADITHALGQINDKDTIMVKPGTYSGQVSLSPAFDIGVVVKAEIPYESKLRNSGTVIKCFYGKGITLEGFDIAHSGAGAGGLVIQIQDLRGTAGDDDYTSRIIIRNNILHDSYNNDILKINNGAKYILVDGNLFYNQEGSDEHIDINSVEQVTVQNNIFMNDFAGSGRTNDNSTSSYIVIKDSNGDSDKIVGTCSVTVKKNIFMNWEGNTGQGFVRLGEDGKPYYEAREITVQNNLMLGNSSNQMRSPFQIMNCKRITFSHNTIHGNLPAKEYGSRIFTYGTDHPTNDSITITANIWSDPTGTMGDVYNRGNDTEHLLFYRNLHWNDGNLFPTSGESIIEVSSDINGLTGNPELPSISGLILPRYDESKDRFTDGSATIAEVFRNLVIQFGIPANNSIARDSADPAYAPFDDILGNAREASKPDIGAVEIQGSLSLYESNPDRNPVIYSSRSKLITAKSTGQFKLIVYDIQGKYIGTSKTAFDMSGYNSGIYIVKLVFVNGRCDVAKIVHKDDQ
ncbi:MAG: T9SS type A sorting domain-containing protein [Bacteroidales bacterium]|nr:T9SS type A sorting domain-containing protein [Bacteroidales bacterium]